MSVELTKDSDALICVLYKTYLERRKNKVNKPDAKYFNCSGDIQRELMQKWTFEDVDETCRELDRAGLLDCEYSDNMAYEITLSDKGIIYMEKRFPDGISTVLEYLAKIKSAIPFL